MKRGRGPDAKESQRQEIGASSFDDTKGTKATVDTFIRHLIRQNQADKPVTIVYKRNDMQYHAEWEDGLIRDASSQKE